MSYLWESTGQIPSTLFIFSRRMTESVTVCFSRMPQRSIRPSTAGERSLINALLKYEDVIIYPVNPASLASYRKAFAHGGGKNDPADARLLAQYLQHYHQQLKPLRQDQPLTRELASLAEDRRQLVPGSTLLVAIEQSRGPLISERLSGMSFDPF